MKTTLRLLLCSIFSIAALASCSTDTSGEYEVFLLIGQSNMAGRGKMLEEDIFPIENVYLLDENGEPTPAIAPLNRYTTVGKPIGVQQINPGNSFAPIMAEYTGKKILLVVNARGGTKLEAWQKGDESQYYSEAVKRCAMAQQYGELRAILWHQGEGNSGNPSNYVNMLSTMVSDLRADLGAENVPFIAGEIAPWHRNRNKFNPALAAMTDKIPNSDFVRSFGLTPLIDAEDPHFSREGQLGLGKRYASKTLELAYGQKANGTIALNAADNRVSFPAAGGSQTIKITTDMDLSTMEPCSEWIDSWCTLSQGEGEVTVTLEANTEGAARETVVYITLYDGFVSKTAELIVSQGA